MSNDYKIIYTRRRSICISVTPDKGVVVRAPYRTSAKTIDKFVRKKEQWIRKHTVKHKELIRLNKKLFADGDTLLYLGREYRLKIINCAQIYVNQYDTIIEAGTGGRDGTIKTLIDKWYRKRAEEYINGRFREMVSMHTSYKFNPTGFSVKPLKSRWGSCTSKGKITISSELIKIDPVFTDHVIVHELCHLKYHNHSKDFYTMLEELEPDYKSIRNSLRKFITRY